MNCRVTALLDDSCNRTKVLIKIQIGFSFPEFPQKLANHPGIIEANIVFDHDLLQANFEDLSGKPKTSDKTISGEAHAKLSQCSKEVIFV